MLAVGAGCSTFVSFDIEWMISENGDVMKNKEKNIEEGTVVRRTRLPALAAFHIRFRCMFYLCKAQHYRDISTGISRKCGE